ncbi:MAG: acyltransferase [Gemmatimonadaceae bacterium]|nr:acyltransferase [Gemmatimonadaceae bacterium]
MPHPTQAAHRSDIDGLRALAVLLVIVHHVAPGVLPGGFAGVDVFFVISGFLMTGIIDRAQRDGSFSYLTFMWRRARRIVPPLVVVLAATLLAGACVLTAPEFTALGRHAIAGSLSASNILLLTESGYFDTAAALKPLLHLWSLGVEEQFYLLWPLLLAVMPSRHRGRLLAVLALSASSLLVSEGLAYDAAAEGFYLLHSRAWEFGLGGTLALLPPLPARLAARHPVHARHLLDAIGGLGILLLLATATQLDGTAAWPGVAALPVVLGTVFVIAAGATALPNRVLLASPAARWIGERSYALYLWHWPPLAFLHILATERGMSPDALLAWSTALMVPAVVLAHLSLAFLERPLRRRAVATERTTRIGVRHLRPYASALAGVAVAGVLVIGGRGLPARYGAAGVDVTRLLTAASPDSIVTYERDATHCRLADRGFATWCRRVGAGGSGIAVFGDSHAEVIFAGLHAVRAAQPMLLTGRKGCAPILHTGPLPVATAETCRRSAQLAHATISADRAIGTVLIASRGPAYLSGAGYGTDSLRAVVPVSGGDTLAMRHAFEDGLLRSIEGFRRAGKHVVLVLGVPEMGFLPDECLVGRPFGLRQVRRPCGVRRADVDRRNAAYRALVQRVTTLVPSVEVFDPTDAFCDAELCRATDAGAVLYSDGNHLTLAGSRMVAERLMPLIVRATARTQVAAAR